MQAIFSASVAITPVAKARARVFKQGGRMRAVTPEKTRKFETQLKSEFALQARFDPLEIPLHVRIEVTRQIPDSWSGRKRQQAIDGLILPTTKPDLDNYVKGVKDAGNGVLWADDSTIVELSAVKLYGEQPGIRVDIFEYRKKVLTGLFDGL